MTQPPTDGAAQQQSAPPPHDSGNTAPAPITRVRHWTPLGLLGALLTYGATAVILWPLLQQLFKTTHQSSQLKEALIILGAAGAYLLYRGRRRLHWHGSHDGASLTTLCSALVLLALHYWLPYVELLLLAFALTLVSLVRFCLGADAEKRARPLLVAFTLFTLLALLLPVLDWPMRMLSGSWSMHLLDALGHGSQLLLVNNEAVGNGAPVLLLTSNEQPFIVAPECNGFGLLSASLLLSLLLGLYRRLGAADLLLNVTFAVLAALAGNILRIVAIVLLTPAFTNHYDLMHEVVGTLFYYSVLLFIWWLIPSRPDRRAASPPQEHHSHS